MTENFENPAGYDTSVTETSGTPAPNTATTGLSLEASECLYITAEAGSEEVYTEFTATDTAYAFFMMRVENTPTSAGRTMFRWAETGGTTCSEMAPDIGPLQAHIYSSGEDQNDAGTTTIAADTTYFCWFEYQRGSGANCQIRFFISTTTTKPGTPECEITTANDTAQVGRLYLGINWAGGAGDIYYDKVRISRTTAFGSNPS